MPEIHPTAFVDDGAELAADVEVGPQAVVERGAVLGAGCRVEAGAQVLSWVRAGEGNVFGRGAVIGGEPQDLGFEAKTESFVEIGAGNTFREHVTVHRSREEGKVTRVGDGNLLMAGSHLAHDVSLGDDNIIANNVLLAGYVQVGSKCFFGGGTGVHQLIRIGDLAMLQGNSSISRDVPPFCTAMLLNRMAGLNLIGMRRSGMERGEIRAVRDLFDRLFRGSGSLSEEAEAAMSEDWPEPAAKLLAFVRGESAKGVITRLGKEG